MAISRAMTIDRWKVSHRYLLKIKTTGHFIALHSSTSAVWCILLPFSDYPSYWCSMLAIYWNSTEAEITLVYQMVFQQLIKHVLCTFCKTAFLLSTNRKPKWCRICTNGALIFFILKHSTWSSERREPGHMPLKTFADSGPMLHAYGYRNNSNKSWKAVNQWSITRD